MYDDCPIVMRRWNACLRAKLSSPEKAEEIEHSEWEKTVEGQHLWSFKPVYAAEAYSRYGVVQTADTAGPDAADESL